MVIFSSEFLISVKDYLNDIQINPDKSQFLSELDQFVSYSFNKPGNIPNNFLGLPKKISLNPQ